VEGTLEAALEEVLEEVVEVLVEWSKLINRFFVDIRNTIICM